jgi:hypothetical protein
MDGGFISELCLALEHRWEPDRLFVIFTAALDESDTHGKLPNTVMAALLGTANRWELLQYKIDELKSEYGFTIFHAKDFRARRGEFKGWSDSKCSRLVNDLAVGIRDNLTESVVIALPRDLYETEYRGGGYVPQKMRLDSQYGVCFRACMERLINIVASDLSEAHKLYVVIERGHKNVNDADRIFYEIQEELLLRGINIMGAITIGKKETCPPLMVADFQAHTWYLSERRQKEGLPGYIEMTRGRLPSSGTAGLTQITHSAESLRDLKTSWEAKKQARIAKWRAARDAKRASSSEPSGDGEPLC